MQMKLANELEIDLLIKLWIEKCDNPKNQNLIIWNKNEIGREVFNKKYLNPKYFICYDHELPCSGFILMDKDERYWPEDQIDDSYYLHKFMVCNGFNGKGYSDQAINLIKHYCKENNKKYLKLDFHSHNAKVKNIYLKNGFKIIKEYVNFENRGYNMTKAQLEIV